MFGFSINALLHGVVWLFVQMHWISVVPRDLEVTTETLNTFFFGRGGVGGC